MNRLCALVALLLALPLAAQEGPSFTLDEHVFNAGGTPVDGDPSSASYSVTLSAIGDPATGRDLTSTTYRMDGGFVVGFSPPREVLGLRFADHDTLTWDSQQIIADYNLYRGSFGGLDGISYGTCREQEIATNATTDSDPVPNGDGYFYLVTAENRLDEEGITGFDSGGSIRLNLDPCP